MWKTDKNGRLERLVVFAVPDDRDGNDWKVAGELVFEGARKASTWFRYNPAWLTASGRFALSPQMLPLRPRGIPGAPHPVPLPFSDWMPDGWGRALLSAAYPAAELGNAEYLAAIGGMRSGEVSIGPSVEHGPERWVPDGTPLLDLPRDEDTLEDLENAAAAADAGLATPSHLQLLVRQSGDLGGGRPKASLLRGGGRWIAKFMAQGDVFDDPKAEGFCLDVAAACGIETPAHHTVKVRGRTVLLVERFDRTKSGRRLGYCSAGTLLGAAPSTYSTKLTYADLAAKARRTGITPCEADLFARLLLNCFLHNTDDHLRNHGFIRSDGGWRLSPVFDIVPQRSGRLVMAPGRDIMPIPDPVTAFEAYPQFSLSRAGATAVYDRIVAGMDLVQDLMDAHEITGQDRRTLAPLLKAAISPPATP